MRVKTKVHPLRTIYTLIQSMPAFSQNLVDTTFSAAEQLDRAASHAHASFSTSVDCKLALFFIILQ